jgi:adenosylcobyric acid synthase
MLRDVSGLHVEGYEIHAGDTTVGAEAVAACLDDGTPVGAVDTEGRVFGCYLHGLFASDPFRQGLLATIAGGRGKRYAPSVQLTADQAFDRLAETLRSSLDLPAIFGLIEAQRGG